MTGRPAGMFRLQHRGRLWGTFPRVIGRYARDLRLLAVETAIHLAPGYFADLVVFDPQSIIDRATYEEPRLPSVGIERRLVGGRADRSG
jgi:N-acyl-D-amino-acid deacylase